MAFFFNKKYSTGFCEWEAFSYNSALPNQDFSKEVCQVCIFCEIVDGRAPAHKIWEDDEYLAILSIFPNTEGFTVVFPKVHKPSYAFALDDAGLTGLTLAAKKVALLLDQTFEDVGRTGMIFEGYGVDHVHAKLFPMHGTSKMQPWQKISSKIDKFFEKYEGYISSHDHQRADDEYLRKIAAKICARRQSLSQQ